MMLTFCDTCYMILVANSCQTFAILWTVPYQAPLSMGFPRQEYWKVLLFPSPRDLPNPGIELWSPALQADSLPSDLRGNPLYIWICYIFYVYIIDYIICVICYI